MTQFKKIYYSIINWLFISEKDGDIYFNIEKEPQVLIHLPSVTSSSINEFFQKNKDTVVPDYHTYLLEGELRYYNKMKGNFVIVFKKDGYYDLFICNYENGLKKCSDDDKSLHFCAKRDLGKSYLHNFYILQPL